MFRSTGQGDTSQRSLHSDDIQGICDIYPSGSGGGTTPECTSKAQCAPNEDCVSGKCVTTGTKGYGGPCDGPSSCNSGICLRSNGVQVCTQLCDSQPCPNGDQCVTVSSSTGGSARACLPGTAQNGTKNLGEACQGNQDCKSEMCVSVPGSGYLCSKSCTVGSNDCGSGYRCAPANVGGLCIPGEQDPTNPTTPQTKKQLGDGCATHAECASGLCGSSPAGKACTQYCSDQQPCPTGYSCASVKGSDKGACIASGPAPGALGSGCTQNSDCNSNLCGGGSDGSRFCTELCQPDSGCPGSFDCVPAGGGKYACVAKAGSDPGANGDGGGGCSVAPATAPSAAPFVPVALAGLALILLGLRRRRRS
jgi:MYXO-CTERM domain-containing protein